MNSLQDPMNLYVCKLLVILLWQKWTIQFKGYSQQKSFNIGLKYQEEFYFIRVTSVNWDLNILCQTELSNI